MHDDLANYAHPPLPGTHLDDHTPATARLQPGLHAPAAMLWHATSVPAPASFTFLDDGHVAPAPLPSQYTVGTPGLDAQGWNYEHVNGMCGPDSIAMILSQYTGTPVSETEVAAWAMLHGEMTRDGEPSLTDLGFGMTPTQAADVLDRAGVPVQLEAGGSLASLGGYLAGGRDVILQVDGDRIWHDGADQGQANHFVVLTGIDYGTGYAYLNDPGDPQGRMEAVPIDTLMSAWATSGNVAIVTETPSPAYVSEQGASVPPPAASPVLLPILLEHELLRAL